MWLSARNEASRLTTMKTRPRLYQRLAFNLIVAVLIGVCFGAGPGSHKAPTLLWWENGRRLPPPFFPVHSHILPTGKVMIWPGDGCISGNDPRAWDPVTETISTLAQPGYDTFYSGHSLLADN